MMTGVLLFYLWITGLHCLFVGTCLHAFFGHRWRRAWQPILLAAVVLAGLETYWIPLVRQAGTSLTVTHPAILRFFGLAPGANIVPHLAPGCWSPAIWLIQGAIAHRIGRAVRRRTLRNAAVPLR